MAEIAAGEVLLDGERRWQQVELVDAEGAYDAIVDHLRVSDDAVAYSLRAMRPARKASRLNPIDALRHE